MVCRLFLSILEPTYFIHHRHFPQLISCRSLLGICFSEDQNWHRWYREWCQKSDSKMGFGEWFTQSLAQGGHLTTDFTGSDLGKHPRRGECCCLFNSSGFERYGRNNAYEERRGGQLSCTTPLLRANELRALNAQLKTTFGSQGGALWSS